MLLKTAKMKEDPTILLKTKGDFGDPPTPIKAQQIRAKNLPNVPED